jgi:hypothetical protein
MTLAPPMISVSQSDAPWIAPARLIRNGQPDGAAIYLGSGFLITAAHLTDANAEMGASIAGVTLPATIVKQGDFEDVDLTLLSVDEQKLPASVVQIQTSLCRAPPWPGDPVLVVDHAGASQSHIISPHIVPFASRSKFQTLIADVATTGNSGSGVFDPNRKCLLGIMSDRRVRCGNAILSASRRLLPP